MDKRCTNFFLSSAQIGESKPLVGEIYALFRSMVCSHANTDDLLALFLGMRMPFDAVCFPLTEKIRDLIVAMASAASLNQIEADVVRRITDAAERPTGLIYQFFDQGRPVWIFGVADELVFLTCSDVAG